MFRLISSLFSLSCLNFVTLPTFGVLMRVSLVLDSDYCRGNEVSLQVQSISFV